ncbi:MAG: MurT ligase domain-containing protein [Lachnospiraceae bacterium]|nr:MurT ligase domain-containing protein [Lachnospiraceae bacterium]
MVAIWSAKIISTACRLSGRQGVTFAGKVALRIDPNCLRDLSAQVRKKIFVVCGTNGKTTTNNLLCSAIEQENTSDVFVGKNSGEDGNASRKKENNHSGGYSGEKTGGIRKNKVVCNHTGSNMLAGVAAAFVLAAKNDGSLDADYACIEIDEASTLRVFPHFKPDYMVLTNLFRDQLDRYGEIDITMDMLNRAMQMAPDMQIIVNADDALSSYLAMESGHEFVTYGITERVFSEEEQGEQHEIREGRFCKNCGARLDYEFYHYSQIGKYNCPNCEFTRPAVDYEALHIDMSDGLAFDVLERHKIARQSSMEDSDDESITDENMKIKDAVKTADAVKTDNAVKTVDSVKTEKAYAVRKKLRKREIHEYQSRHIYADYRGFYNIYNILAAYSAARNAGLKLNQFEQILSNYNPQNGRMEHFQIRGTDVILNLAKNPAGFNQNISAVMEDKKEKDIIIVINDNAQDGTDISWLWDVDFDRFGKKKTNVNESAGKVKENQQLPGAGGTGEGIHSITVSGIRCQDMRLRMKYVDIPCEMTPDVKDAIEARLADGCGNLYVLVNYTALFSTRNILAGMK